MAVFINWFIFAEISSCYKGMFIYPLNIIQNYNKNVQIAGYKYVNYSKIIFIFYICCTCKWYNILCLKKDLFYKTVLALWTKK